MATQAAAKVKKPRKTPVRREGERYRVALQKGDAKLSFSVSPSATGYTLRARHRSDGGMRVVAEHFAETQGTDSYVAAKKRVEELAGKAMTKGWVQKKGSRSIEDLF